MQITVKIYMITPQIKADKLADKLGIQADIYLKREDLHPFGSHKGRSIPLMIKKYTGEGISNFVISSSGNAALAAIYAVNELNKKNTEEPVSLTVFVGKKIDESKLELLKKESANNKLIQIKQTHNPKQDAFLAGKADGVKNLRQSTDDSALSGYDEVARELSDIKNLEAVFIPTSSGTLAEGLYQGLKKRNLSPEFHIVQTSSCHPFVKSDTNSNEPASLASAIVDKIGHRAKNIENIIGESRGAGWIATNSEIIEAINLLKQNENISISANSALSIVGLKKAALSGRKFSGSIVCFLTGR